MPAPHAHRRGWGRFFSSYKSGQRAPLSPGTPFSRFPNLQTTSAFAPTFHPATEPASARLTPAILRLGSSSAPPAVGAALCSTKLSRRTRHCSFTALALQLHCARTASTRLITSASATKYWRGSPASVVVSWSTAHTPVVTPIPLLARLCGPLAGNRPIAQVCIPPPCRSGPARPLLDDAKSSLILSAKMAAPESGKFFADGPPGSAPA